MRIIWLICGLLSLGLGAIGAVTPILPTVPLILLAAFCFARSSTRLHGWLLNHPTFGPSITDWQERGAISVPAKRLATVSIIAAFGLSVEMKIDPWLLGLQVAILGCVLIFIWSRPAA